MIGKLKEVEINQKEINHLKKRKPSLTVESEEDDTLPGRWTKEEHDKFVDGLKKYGKNWKLIEDFVDTRSGSQIRSHAQKFFSRIEKQCNISKNEIFKYLDKIDNEFLTFNCENEQYRKKKIWEIIKATESSNCTLGYTQITPQRSKKTWNLFLEIWSSQSHT